MRQLLSPLPLDLTVLILGAAGQIIRIHGSSTCPNAAMVAVERHGWCYSIAATDSASTLTFRLLETLLSARIADSVRPSAMPMLTVPVSR